MKRKSAMQEASELRQERDAASLTVGVLFGVDQTAHEKMLEELGSQTAVIEFYRDIHKEFLVKNRTINVEEIDISPSISEWFVVTKTGESTLGRSALDALTFGAITSWLSLADNLNIETFIKWPGRGNVRKFFVTAEPDVNGEQLLSARRS